MVGGIRLTMPGGQTDRVRPPNGLRRCGSFPHSGFGLAIERTVAWICGLKHIRDTVAYPRMMDKVYP